MSEARNVDDLFETVGGSLFGLRVVMKALCASMSREQAAVTLSAIRALSPVASDGLSPHAADAYEQVLREAVAELERLAGRTS